jgi:histidinol-phosphate aminotransferase
MADVLDALLSARVPAAFAELHPYVPDPTVVPVRLDANEATPLLPTLTAEERAAFDAMLASVEPARYPDVRARALRAEIARSMDVEPDAMVIGCGSDEVISILMSTLARAVDGKPPVVLAPSPTFVMYRISGRVHGYDVVDVPLDADCDLDEARTIEAVRAHRPAVVFLATPNNPTSRAYDRSKVARVVEAAAKNDPPALVVIDEAYLPFRQDDGDGLSLLRAHPNVAVMRTLSKIGLAALRVGWMVARPALVAEMEKARLPYDLPAYSQAIATCAFGPLRAAIDRHVASIVAERARLAEKLTSMHLSFARPDANFFWVRVPRPAADVSRAMKERGVLVRAFPHSPDRLRITVGTRDEDDRMLDALTHALGASP